MNKDLITIAEHYGTEAQMIQLIEEMAELTHALTVYIRLKQGQVMEPFATPEAYGISWEDEEKAEFLWCDIVEEIADVEICLSQVKHLFGIDRRELRDYKREKIKRQLERIEHEENN